MSFFIKSMRFAISGIVLMGTLCLFPVMLSDAYAQTAFGSCGSEQAVMSDIGGPGDPCNASDGSVGVCSSSAPWTCGPGSSSSGGGSAPEMPEVLAVVLLLAGLGTVFYLRRKAKA